MQPRRHEDTKSSSYQSATLLMVKTPLARGRVEREYDITPDGKYLICAIPADHGQAERSQQINVVLN